MDYIGFFRERDEYGYLSNFAYCGFVYTMENGTKIKFSTSEHAVHYLKALLFNDVNISSKILKTWSPMRVKHLGRMIKNFDNKVWEDNKIRIYHDVIKAKFTDPNNEDIKQSLLNTGDAILVECSPYDKIWGIGYSKESPEFINKDTDKWGQNLLGHVLMTVRDEIRREESDNV